MVALRRAALYLGAFLGPFGGGLTAAMLPELGADFGVPTATASVSTVSTVSRSTTGRSFAK